MLRYMSKPSVGKSATTFLRRVPSVGNRRRLSGESIISEAVLLSVWTTRFLRN